MTRGRNYQRQNNSAALTPRQLKRLRQKAHIPGIGAL